MTAARRREAERRRWVWRGHAFGLYFALGISTALYAGAESLAFWAAICLAVAIFFWYKAGKV